MGTDAGKETLLMIHAVLVVGLLSLQGLLVEMGWSDVTVL